MGFDNAAAVRQWYEWAKNQKRYAREREKIRQYTARELAKQLAIADKKASRVQGFGREKPTELELKQKPYWLWRWSELLTERDRREGAPADPPPPEPESTPEPVLELPEGWRMVQCDHTGYVTQYGVYWRGVHVDGMMTEPTLYKDTAELEAWKAHEALLLQRRE
jgi:hypothetical protein